MSLAEPDLPDAGGIPGTAPARQECLHDPPTWPCRPRGTHVSPGDGLAGVQYTSRASPAAATEADKALAQHSLRGPLTREQMYFVMADRFANGSTRNDSGGLTGDRLETGLDPTDKGFYHGGDLGGLTGKLDYIKGLGTTAIWLTPVVQEPAGAGHRRRRQRRLPRLLDHRLHPGRPAPRHERRHEDAGRRPHTRKGMKVFFDIITNHTADVIDYAQEQYSYRRQGDEPVHAMPTGKAFDDRDYAGGDTFPALDAGTSVPVHAGLPRPARRERQGPGLAQRPHAVPQPRRLDVLRREHRVRRLLRPRRPVHRAARGRHGHDQDLPAVGRLRHRRLPHRHRQARQHGVLAAVLAGDPGPRQGARQRRLLHVRRGLRRQPVAHVAVHDAGQAPGHPRLRLPGRGQRTSPQGKADRPVCATCTPATTGTPTPTPTPTSCRPSSETTTWAGSP